MPNNKLLLEKLSILLRAFDTPIVESNTRDSLIPFQTNRNELAKALANLEYYHENERFLLNKKPIGGIAIVLPYSSPIFSLFGISLAAALLVNGDKFPIKIHFPSALNSLGNTIEQLFNAIDEFSFIEICHKETNEFIEENINNENIKTIHVFGEIWIQDYIPQAIESKTSIVFMGSGNNPAIVHETANLEETAEKILQMGYALSGQSAFSLKRILIDKRIDEQNFNSILKKKCSEISYSKDPFEKAIVGPLKLSQKVFALENRIIDAIYQGAVPFNYHVEAASHGWLVKPSLFFNTNHQMKLVQKINFGPVLTVEYSDIENLVNLANSTEYGLTASVFGNPKEIKNMVNELNKSHGIVLINTTFHELISKEYGYIGIWGGYGKSFFHVSEATNWQISQDIKPLVTYFSK